MPPLQQLARAAGFEKPEALGSHTELANMRELLELAERKQNQLQAAAARLKAQKSEASSDAAGSPGGSMRANARLGSPSRSEKNGFSSLAEGSSAVWGTDAAPRVGMVVVRPHSPGSPKAGRIGYGQSLTALPNSRVAVSPTRHAGVGCSASVSVGAGAGLQQLLSPGVARTPVRARSPTQAVPVSPTGMSYGYRVVPANTAIVPTMRVPVSRQSSGPISTPSVPAQPRGSSASFSTAAPQTLEAVPVSSISRMSSQNSTLHTAAATVTTTRSAACGSGSYPPPLTRPTLALPEEAVPEVVGLASRLPEPVVSTGIGRVESTGRNSPLPFAVDIVQGKRLCGRGRVYLYQAPFVPAVRYTSGGEYFVLPRGWAVMRSRQGLLVWLELIEDSPLQEAIHEMVAGSPKGARAWPPGGAPRAGSPCKRPPQLLLSLPSASGGAHGQLEIRSARACPIDPAVRVACEDVIVLHPSISNGADPDEGHMGFRAVLVPTSSSSSSFDELFKAWLSSWQAQA